MRGVYKTAQGKIVNMDNLRLQHENEKSIGNMGVNARGDQVDRHGNIVKSKSQIMQDHYNTQRNNKPKG